MAVRQSHVHGSPAATWARLFFPAERPPMFDAPYSVLLNLTTGFVVHTLRHSKRANV